jgi:16S rRNA (uracil1498-N3)-methyltransferase
MPPHRVHLDQPLSPGQVAVRGDEAHHAARVKRLQPGDRIEALNGRGQIARGTVQSARKDGREWLMVLDLASVEDAPRTSTQIRVFSAAPKGSRLTDLIDGLSQAGAASWALLDTERGAVDPRPGKLDRLARAAAEASKQCGRAWNLEVAPAQTLAEVLSVGPVILADVSGQPCRRTGAPAISLLIGPEGGWTERELHQARDAGAAITRFGPHTMRIETAAMVATAIILDVESRA